MKLETKVGAFFIASIIVIARKGPIGGPPFVRKSRSTTCSAIKRPAQVLVSSRSVTLRVMGIPRKPGVVTRWVPPAKKLLSVKFVSRLAKAMGEKPPVMPFARSMLLE